ncbi:hypothetical protein N9007_00530 [bacterium]|nr:hypothetical protein [Mariniblastus sp.]MDB4399566.1 hypothetical protein [bacterium]
MSWTGNCNQQVCLAKVIGQPSCEPTEEHFKTAQSVDPRGADLAAACQSTLELETKKASTIAEAFLKCAPVDSLMQILKAPPVGKAQPLDSSKKWEEWISSGADLAAVDPLFAELVSFWCTSSHLERRRLVEISSEPFGAASHNRDAVEEQRPKR